MQEIKCEIKIALENALRLFKRDYYFETTNYLMFYVFDQIYYINFDSSCLYLLKLIDTHLLTLYNNPFYRNFSYKLCTCIKKKYGDIYPVSHPITCLNIYLSKLILKKQKIYKTIYTRTFENVLNTDISRDIFKYILYTDV